MSRERRPAARLPADPEYWDDLAARSVDAALRSAATSGDGTHAAAARGGAAVDPWWRGISDAAFVLAASAVFALIGGSLLLGERSPPADRETHALTGALAPEDPLLASLLAAPAGPPPASALLRLVALRGDER